MLTLDTRQIPVVAWEGAGKLPALLSSLIMQQYSASYLGGGL